MKKLFSLILALILLTGTAFAQVLVDGNVAATDEYLVEYGYDYSMPEEVALYLHVFCELPPNYITKDEAYDLGWKSVSYDLWDVAYGMSIGGDIFGNREGLLPEDEDRIWYECDVNYQGGNRGAERLVFSSDGLIYYTFDHYESFECMYDGWLEGWDEAASAYDYAYSDDWGTSIGGLLDSLLGGGLSW